MSFHQVEDIIEDSIHVIHKALIPKWEKRDLIYNLYRFQHQFDTGYTLFRVTSILQKNHYLYSFPLEKHPDYSEQEAYFNQFNEQSDEWILADIYDQESWNLYLSNNKLWFVAGDPFWERVKIHLPTQDQKPPNTIAFPSVFLTLLKLSNQQEEQLFAKRWYATFVNSIVEGYIDEAEGIPKSFELWISNEHLLNLRKFVAQHPYILSIEDEDYEGDELLAPPALEEELEVANKPHEVATIRFLLDFQTDTDTIFKQYEKALNHKVDLSKYELIYDFFREKLTTQWQDGIKELGTEKGFITFLKKQAGEKYFKCLLLYYDVEFKLLGCRIGIQNTQILEWQQRQASPKPELQHFTELLLSYGSEEELNTDKNLSDWGGWKYNTKQSKKTLVKRLHALWEFHERYHSKIDAIYSLPLDEWSNSGDSATLMQKREKLLEQGISFFGNEMDFKLFMACINLKNGKTDIGQQYIDEVQTLLEQGLGSDQLKERITQGLAYLNRGVGVYPEISTIYSSRLYETSMNLFNHNIDK